MQYKTIALALAAAFAIPAFADDNAAQFAPDVSEQGFFSRTADKFHDAFSALKLPSFPKVPAGTFIGIDHLNVHSRITDPNSGADRSASASGYRLLAGYRTGAWGIQGEYNAVGEMSMNKATGDISGSSNSGVSLTPKNLSLFGTYTFEPTKSVDVTAKLGYTYNLAKAPTATGIYIAPPSLSNGGCASQTCPPPVSVPADPIHAPAASKLTPAAGIAVAWRPVADSAISIRLDYSISQAEYRWTDSTGAAGSRLVKSLDSTVGLGIQYQF